MSKKITSFLKVAITLAVGGVLVMSAFGGEKAFAQVFGGITDQQLGLQYGAATGLPASDVRLTVARIIRVAMSLLGTVALIIVVYGGFLWMTAGGNEERTGEAKKWITAGVIGLAIILAAYSITIFIVQNLVKATSGA